MGVMTTIIISKLSFLSPSLETGAGYACIHDGVDIAPLHYGTTASIYRLNRPLRTPAMQYHGTLYDHF